MSLAKIKAKLAAAKRARLDAVKLVDVWIRICAWDQVYHEALDFVVDRAMVAQLDEYLRWAAAHGHLPPVLRQHTEDGSNFGLVRGIAAREDGPYLHLGLHADVAERYKAGRLPYWSPHFEWEFPDPHRPSADDASKPHVWPVRLREMSFVSVPHLLNNPPANIALGSTTKSARVMCAAPTRGDTKMDLTPEDMAAIKALAALAPKLTKLVDAMDEEPEIEMADPPADEPPAVPMANEPPKDGSPVAAMSASLTKLTGRVDTLAGENKALKVQLAAQERKAAEAEVAADLAGVALEPDDIKSLVSLKLSSDPEARKAYGVTVKAARAAAGASVGGEVGAMGSAAQLSGQRSATFAKLGSKVKADKLHPNSAEAMALLRGEGIKPQDLTEDDWASWDKACR